jgi:hypothetical protein
LQVQTTTWVDNILLTLKTLPFGGSVERIIHLFVYNILDNIIFKVIKLFQVIVILKHYCQQAITHSQMK